MPSTGTYFAQPITRKFVVTQNENVDNNGAYYFDEATILSWLLNNSSDLQQIGSLVIVSGNFYNVLNDMGNDGIYQDRKTLTDMGDEYVIGNTANSRLIVLRKVQGYASVQGGGLNGVVGYVCIENNTTEVAPNNWGRYTVRVARV